MLVPLFFLKGYKANNAGEVAGVSEFEAEQLIKAKMAVPYDGKKHEPKPEAEPVKEQLVRVRAKKAFDRHNTGEIFGVPKADLERLLDGGWVEEVAAEGVVEVKQVAQPTAHKMMSAPTKAK